MPFVSQAQQRFAFGTDQPWAKRWADETDFAKLPKRVRRVRRKAGIGGCSCGMTTKGEQIAPGITRIRGNLCNVHGKYGPCDAAQSGKKKPGGKGRAAKPKKPVKTPEQRQQERAAQQAQNRTDVLSRMSIAPDGQAALDALRQGAQPDPAAVARAGLVEAGLAEQGRDGSYRLTGSGRAALNAADAGDFGRAGATVGAARDRVSARQERIAAREARKKKPKGGKGKKPTTTTPAATAADQPGTGREQPPSPAEQRAQITFAQRQQDRQDRIARRAQADADRAQQRQEASSRRAEADARRSAADERRARSDRRAAARAESGANRTNRSSNRRTKAEEYGGIKRSNLDDSVFAGPDRSFPIKTAQDVRDAVRSLGRTKHDKATVKRGIIRRARAIGAVDALPESWRTEKDYPDQRQFAGYTMEDWDDSKPDSFYKDTRFTVYKDSSGADRWLSVSSTAYKDRDREIVSTKALQGAVALADASGYRGPLRFWHVPGVEFGDCDFQATAQDGRFLLESGTFRSPALAAAVKARADGYQVSIGFTHPANEPDQRGVFSHIAIFERSLVPKGRASNPFTTVALATKESRMLTTEKAAALKDLLGGDETLLQGLLSHVASTDKAAQDGGVAYKDADAPAWAQALIGRIEAIETSLKAAPPPEAPVEDEEEVEVEAKDDGAEMMAEDTPAEGDENFLSPGEIQSIVGAVVTAITPLLDIEKKMSGYVGEMKSMVGGLASQKDATMAEIKQDVTALKEQVADLSGSQPRILAGGYRASQAASTVTTDETKLKDAQPAADPVATSFAGWLQDMGIGGAPQQAS